MPEVLAPAGSEILPPPRRGEHVGLQGRLLIGQAFLDPSRDLGRDVTLSDLKINDQTFRPANALSTLERTHEWRDRLGNDHAAQKDAWKQSVVRVMARKRDYFQAEEGSKWKTLYGELGVEVVDITLDKADSLYSRFFSAERRGKEVERFVADILALDIYKDPDRDDAIDFAKIKEDLPAYSWLGTIFGQGSALLISELLAAEARFSSVEEDPRLVQALNKKTGLFTRKRRVDNLEPIEEGLLTYTNNAFKIGELKVPQSLSRYIRPRIVEKPEGDDVMPIAPPLPPVPDDDEPFIGPPWLDRP